MAERGFRYSSNPERDLVPVLGPGEMAVIKSDKISAFKELIFVLPWIVIQGFVVIDEREWFRTQLLESCRSRLR